MLPNARILLLLTTLALSLFTATADAQIAWRNDLRGALHEAAQTNRNVLVHFWAPWCAPCQQLEAGVFRQPQVAEAMQQSVIPVKLNFDESQQIANAYGVKRLPADVILTPQGRVIGKVKSPGSVSGYVSMLASVRGAGGADARPANSAVAEVATNGQSPYSGLTTQINTAGQVADNYAQTTAYQAAPTTSGHYADATTGNASHVQTSLGSNGTRAAIYGDRYSQALAPSSTAERYSAANANGVSTGYAQQTHVQAAHAPSSADPAPTTASIGGNSTVQPHAVQSAPATPIANSDEPPLGLDGFCPVTLKQQRRWVKGDKRYGIVHRGRLYLFAGPNEQQLFWTQADAFSPVLSGVDPVLALDNGASVAGKREHGVEYNGAVYLFSSESTLQHFSRNPERYAAGVRQAMRSSTGTILR